MEALKTFETLSESEKILFFEKVLNSLNESPKKELCPTNPSVPFLENVTNSIKKTSLENNETSPSISKGQKTLDYWLVKSSKPSNTNKDGLASTSKDNKLIKVGEKEKSTLPSRKRSLAVSVGNDKKSDALNRNKRSKISLSTCQESTSSSLNDKTSTVSSPIVDKSSSVSPNIEKLTVSPASNKRSSVSPVIKKVTPVPPVVHSISINSRQSTTSPVKNALSPIDSEKVSLSGGSDTTYNLRSKRRNTNSTDATTAKKISSNLTKFKKGEAGASNQFSEYLTQTDEICISNISDSLVTNTCSSSSKLTTNSKILKNTETIVNQSNCLANSSNVEYEAYCKLKIEFSQHGLDINDILKDKRVQNFLESIDEKSPTEDSIMLIDTYENDSGVIVPIIHTHKSLSLLTKKLHEMQKQFKKRAD